MQISLVIRSAVIAALAIVAGICLLVGVGVITSLQPRAEHSAPADLRGE